MLEDSCKNEKKIMRMWKIFVRDAKSLPLVPEISFDIQRCTYKRFFWHTKLKNERKFCFNTQSRCTSVVNFNLKHLLVNFLSSLLKKKFSKLVFFFRFVGIWNEFRSGMNTVLKDNLSFILRNDRSCELIQTQLAGKNF